MADNNPQPPRQFSPWMQISALIFVATTVFSAGGLYRGLVDLQDWRVQVTKRAELYDQRLRAVESMHASTQADLTAIKASLARIERGIDAREP